VQPIGNGSNQVLFDKPGEGELAGAVDGHEEIELPFSGLHLSDIDVDRACMFAIGSRTVGEGLWDSA